MNEPLDPNYCLVKYFHYEATNKPLDCKKCVMDCKYKNNTGGEKNDKPTD